ncbi:GerAB/ArcD/ProY family transporter [Paenibacillus koleovorans]|uniref:GerAB/ArcD/ProY family transporter n=1 Tax=Paenibacillus koleovorans TaxID=121608 RepID=UPI000FDBE87F|nr:endospore germination permease [Paenibacillus koleovorans]
MNDSSPIISSRSFAVLVTFFMVGTSILIAPAPIAADAKQDAWLACFFGVLLNLVLVLMYIWLGGRQGRNTLTGYCEQVLGRWFGKAVALLFVAFFFLLAALMIGDLGQFLTSQSYPETPIEVLMLFFASAIVIAVRAGLPVFTRASEVFFPWMIILFLLLVIPIFPKIDTDYLRPMLENGFLPVLGGAYNFYGLQELVVMLMIYPHVREAHKKGKAFVVGVLVGGTMLLLTTIGSIVLIGPALSANEMFPAYSMAKNTNIGHFFQRIEGIMMMIWVLSIFFKVSITFYAAMTGFAQAFDIKDNKSYVVPMGLGLVILALLCYPNPIYVQLFLDRTWPPLALVFSLLLPAFLLGASYMPWVRKKQKANRQKAN